MKRCKDDIGVQALVPAEKQGHVAVEGGCRQGFRHEGPMTDQGRVANLRGIDDPSPYHIVVNQIADLRVLADDASLGFVRPAPFSSRPPPPLARYEVIATV